jgi:hypothetical protein
MRLLACMTVILVVSGCSAWGQHISSNARYQILACQDATNKGDGWGVWMHCDKAADVPLPPECLKSDEAARTPKCASIAQAEALSGSVESGASAGLTTGAASLPIQR